MKNKTCNHDFKNAIRKGRAHYVCPKCGKDISLILMLMEEAKIKFGPTENIDDLIEQEINRLENILHNNLSVKFCTCMFFYDECRKCKMLARLTKLRLIQGGGKLNKE